jgi:acrylyl-CoA reductase (NADPH)
MPFILRNVQLRGVDSVQAPMARRIQAWARLADELDLAKLNDLSFDLPFSDLKDLAADILAGKVRGRAVVDLNR